MSKLNQNILLISGDYPLIASPTLAKAYGVAAATFLQKLHYCLENNEAKVLDGKKYWFHSYEQWQQTLGIYSVSTIKRIVSKLKQAGILVVEKLAKNKWLQTNFYSINYRKLKQLIQPNKNSETQPQQLILTTHTTDSTLPNIVNSAENAQPAMLSHSIQKAFQTINAQSTTAEQPLKTAKKSYTQPDSTISGNMSIQGLSQSLCPIAPDEIINNMPLAYRYFYQALRQQRVDIHYEDQRIQQLLKYQKQIIRHIAYIKHSFCGHERYRWHQLEQLQMESYLGK